MHEEARLRSRVSELEPLVDALRTESAKLRAENNRLENEVSAWKDAHASKARSADLQLRDWADAVNVMCSCGGRGPDDGCCQACSVYHIAKGRTEKRTEKQEGVCGSADATGVICNRPKGHPEGEHGNDNCAWDR